MTLAPWIGDRSVAAANRRRVPRRRLIGWLSDKQLSCDFWMFFIAALCFDLGFAMFLFLYNLFLLDLGFNERQLGMVAGAMTLGSMAGTIPVGYVSQRIGLRRILSVGFLITPIISGLRTVVSTENIHVALAFVTGLFLSIWSVCFSPAAASLTTEKNRTFAFSLLFSVGIGTGGLGALVGGCMPGWLQSTNPTLSAPDAKRVVLLLCCGIVALGLIPVLRLKMASSETRRTGLHFDPFLLRFLPAAALWSLVAGAFMPFATAYLSKRVHIALAHIGIIFAMSQMAQVAAVLAAPAVFRRAGLVAGIMYSQMATAVALAGLAQVHQLPAIVVLYLSFTAFHWMGGPGIYSLLMNRVEERSRSIASAANSLVTSLSQAVASATAGAAYVTYGYPRVFSVVAVVAAVAAASFWILLRENRARPGESHPTTSRCLGINISDNEVTNSMQGTDK